MNKKIKMTEAQLNEMITVSIKKCLVKESMTEGMDEGMDEAWYDMSVKDAAKKVGKGLAKGALAAGIGTAATLGGAYCLDKGLENQERYEQNLNRQAKYLGGPTRQEAEDWCTERGLEINSSNLNQAYEFLDGQYEAEYGDSMNGIYEGKNGKLIVKESTLRKMIRESIERVYNEFKDAQDNRTEVTDAQPTVKNKKKQVKPVQNT